MARNDKNSRNKQFELDTLRLTRCNLDSFESPDEYINEFFLFLQQGQLAIDNYNGLQVLAKYQKFARKLNTTLTDLNTAIHLYNDEWIDFLGSHNLIVRQRHEISKIYDSVQKIITELEYSTSFPDFYLVPNLNLYEIELQTFIASYQNLVFIVSNPFYIENLGPLTISSFVEYTATQVTHIIKSIRNLIFIKSKRDIRQGFRNMITHFKNMSDVSGADRLFCFYVDKTILSQLKVLNKCQILKIVNCCSTKQLNFWKIARDMMPT
jgi:hypothetical protein